MTTQSQRRIAREIEERLNADPTIQALFGGGRQASWCYFETRDGWMFVWTTERMGDGKYHSAIQQPYGEGSRSGDKRKITRWKPVREVGHSTRTAAKARALRLCRAHANEHPEWRDADAARQQARNQAVRLRYFQRTGRWPETWGPKPGEEER